MAHDPLVCPECHDTVPPGRLSCPHCGTVLAAVAARSWTRPSVAGGERADDDAPLPRSVSDVLSGAGPRAASMAEPVDAAVTLAEPVAEEPQPAAQAQPAPMEPEPVAEHEPVAADPEPAAVAPDPPVARPDAIPPVLRPVDQPREPAFLLDDEAAPPPLAPIPPVPDRLPVAPLQPAQSQQPPLTPAYMPRPGFVGRLPQAAEPAADETPEPAPPPGAWLPPAQPTAVAGSAGAAAATFSAPPAPFQARAWESQSAATAGPAQAAEDGADAPAGAGDRVRRLFTIEGVNDAANIVVLAGSMAIAISFLVPWSRVMIGAGSSGSYTSSWGLAGPWHVIVFLAAVVVFGLAAMPNRIPLWFRSGVLGLAVGSLAVGLAWPYAFGPLGAGPGVVLVIVAGLMLVGGGVTAVAADRHAPPPPTV